MMAVVVAQAWERAPLGRVGCLTVGSWHAFNLLRISIRASGQIDDACGDGYAEVSGTESDDYDYHKKRLCTTGNRCQDAGAK